MKDFNRDAFNPKELVSSFEKEYPNKHKIKNALENLFNPNWESDAYARYTVSENAKHRGCLDFNDKKYGLIVMDIYSDDTIGGIEFVDNIKIVY